MSICRVSLTSSRADEKNILLNEIGSFTCFMQFEGDLSFDFFSSSAYYTANAIMRDLQQNTVYRQTWSCAVVDSPRLQKTLELRRNKVIL